MLKENDVLNQGMIALEQRLAQISFLEVHKVIREGGQEAGYDAIVCLNTPQGSYRLIIDVKNRGEPRYARESVNALIRSIKGPNMYGLFIAPYISPQSAQVCREGGVGYLDLSGNCLISFGQVYILVENRPNKQSKRRDLVTLYAPKTERILRVLLSEPFRPWRIIDLSETARVSLGMASMVKKRLADREWVQDSQRGFRLIEPEKLLKEWADNYSFQRNDIREYYTMKPLAEVETALGNACQRDGIEYAFTGFSASNRLAPGVRNQRAMVYLQGDEQRIATELGLKPVTSGANINLIRPYDEGIFLGADDLNGVRVVSPVQAYLDLKRSRGRGEEAAEILFNEVIQKQWSTLQTTMQKL